MRSTQHALWGARCLCARSGGGGKRADPARGGRAVRWSFPHRTTTAAGAFRVDSHQLRAFPERRRNRGAMAPTHSTDEFGAAGVPNPPPSGLHATTPGLERKVAPEPDTPMRGCACVGHARSGKPLARAAITRLCEHLEIDDRPTEDIRLAVTEACSNCALHAYDERAESPTYTLDARVDRRDLRIVVSDRGMGLHGSRANRSGGLGYGLGMIRQLADSSHRIDVPRGGHITSSCASARLVTLSRCRFDRAADTVANSSPPLRLRG